MIEPTATLRVEALTFDLDDTLYDNAPILAQAEQQMRDLLAQLAEPWQQISVEQTIAFREALQAQEIRLQHDLTLARWQAIYQQSQQLGIAAPLSHDLADQALHQFRHWRNQIQLSDEVRQLLQQLAERYPLVGVTNGNLDWRSTELSHYFRTVFCSGVDGRAKPFTDLFHCASRYLKLPVQRILHIGDSLRCDVYGAKRAGHYAAWLDLGHASPQQAYLSLVDIHLNHITDLPQWLR